MGRPGREAHSVPPEHAAKTPPPTQVQVGDQEYTLQVERDARLRTMGRWTVNGQTIRLRIPPRTSTTDLSHMIEGIVAKLKRRRKRAIPATDEGLQQRAEALNRRYFDGELSWTSIRWATNMRRRLGSCTNGGPTDGEIRISDRIRDWPEFVVDYIIAHEICHRKHSNHSPAFWEYLNRYPLVERARGFAEGFAFAQGLPADDEDM